MNWLNQYCPGSYAVGPKARTNSFGVPARLASLPALALGIGAQFLGNKWLAFRDPSPAWLRQATLFLAVEGLGLVANLVVFDRLLVWTPLPYLVCRVLSTSLVYFALCLPLWARVFAGGPRSVRGGCG